MLEVGQGLHQSSKLKVVEAESEGPLGSPVWVIDGVLLQQPDALPPTFIKQQETGLSSKNGYLGKRAVYQVASDIRGKQATDISNVTS